VPIQVQNARIHLLDEGSGTPTLFLHGNPDSSILWRGLMAEMKHHFHCLAPDLPGFGHSAIPEGFDYSLESMASFVDGVLNAARIHDPVNLVVHDFGGPYGLAWAVKHPQRVRRMAIMNTMFFSDYEWHYWAKIWRTPVFGELSMMTMTWPVFHASLRKGSPALSEEHIRETYSLLSPETKKMVLQLYRATTPANFRGWEEKLLELTRRVPTCVLWGDRDPYIGPAYAERFGTDNVVHFSQNGHWLPAEAPKEVAKKLMECFG
jgi:pimeloyl-ACP methyl ester carboxylesterase